MKLYRAEKGHLSQLQELYRALFQELAQMKPELFQSAEVSYADLLRLLDSRGSDIFLVSEGAQAVGFAVVHEQESPRLNCFVPRRYATLEDLFVESGYRGRGAGKALVRAVEDWARGRGLEFLELEVLPENKVAMGLYESRGFRPFMQNMRRSL